MLILVSGPVGVGKTTLCLRLAERARECGMRINGALAPAVMEGGRKVGIQTIELRSGETRLLARVDRDLRGARVGSYSFDDGVLEWVTQCCERALEERTLDTSTRSVVFVDEIGRLELIRGGGMARLIPLLAQPCEQVVVTIVRDTLVECLREQVAASEPRVIWVDSLSRERAWIEMAELVLGEKISEAWLC